MKQAGIERRWLDEYDREEWDRQIEAGSAPHAGGRSLTL